MAEGDFVIANPLIVLREEFDDWAILFNPDNGGVFGCNPVSVLVWKCLDGKHTLADIVGKIKASFSEVSGDVDKQVASFVKTLTEARLAGYELKPQPPSDVK